MERKYNERDHDVMHFRKTMKKISKFAYNWKNKEDAKRGFVRCPDGLAADSKFSLTDVLEEARSS